MTALRRIHADGVFHTGARPRPWVARRAVQSARAPAGYVGRSVAAHSQALRVHVAHAVDVVGDLAGAEALARAVDAAAQVHVAVLDAHVDAIGVVAHGPRQRALHAGLDRAVAHAATRTVVGVAVVTVVVSFVAVAVLRRG